MEKSSALQRQGMKPTQKQKIWRRISLIVLVLIAAAAVGITVYISSLDISKLQTPLSQPSYLYDQKGVRISQLSSSRIEPLTSQQIPQVMKNAIIAVEDRRFYEHKGVDIRSIIRALYRDVISGDFSEGGSTITQQLAKNMFLASDKTLTRKLKDAAYALKIEAVLNKDDILAAYLNRIYFGEGRWGLENAAQLYFGKDAGELTLEESAMLAGLLKAPTIYSPLNNKEKALERRNLVLSLMKEQNYISPEDFENAVIQPIVLKKGEQSDLMGQYAPYVDYVIEEAIDRVGFTEEQILNGGLQIYTQMDASVQKAAEDVYQDSHYFPQGKEDQIVQSGVVILDHATGGIRGLVGYRGERVYRGLNHATSDQLQRQPGSALKPISVYGPALEQGYTPQSLLRDYPLNIEGYAPENYDYQYHGYVTMQEAISNSWNIPAVWLLNEIGIESGVDFANRCGIPLEQADHSLSLALGGISKGVTPLLMAQAYGAFANLGVMNKPYAITKITTKDGRVLYQAESEAQRVTSPSVAYNMTLMLQDVVANGTGKNAQLDRPTAGKTGSVELPPIPEFAGISKGVKDVWFVGYTPELTAAVWMGYDNTDRSHYLTTSGGSEPAGVFREILNRALEGKPVVPFDVPQEYIDENKPSSKFFKWFHDNFNFDNWGSE
ncbi:penicillin-binding protein, 1A family [Desulfosporosinus orientis DSM 765]|uniref:Penicillin-binding protein 1A n=1 Tax=Desulfosporosinus orientis (strain ATCC 19365 / DSM 765 / NCIMB 8382 / VKM B-1628 / Singapore I) TaxID=768706 RepID=G7WB83_DESOD|nr:PBP1A family penicillin-binding protein [Desulfosporosinus orientis]AET67864.1 penicillin-binding protein, 1A family [Desulfosporosinus orientis DSM 765]